MSTRAIQYLVALVLGLAASGLVYLVRHGTGEPAPAEQSGDGDDDRPTGR